LTGRRNEIETLLPPNLFRADLVRELLDRASRFLPVWNGKRQTMSRRKQFAIWYVIFCSPNLITHAYKTKRAAKNAVRDLRKDFPDYAWSMKRLIEQKTATRRKRRRKK
jgi:hypothetical protein